MTLYRNLPVAIIGAGYAGLACAVTLARHGAQVSVFERSNTLGGRARVVNQDSWKIDNGQHILLGAYHETLRLMRLMGVSPKQLCRLPLTLHLPGQMHLQAACLPAPFHLAVGLVRARGLDKTDKLALLCLLQTLKKQNYRLDPRWSVATLLQQTRQTSRVCQRIWEPLCVAALNTPVDSASAQIFANVLRDSLGGGASDSELLLPRTDLSELFAVPAARYLATRRGKLRTSTTIRAIHLCNASDPDNPVVEAAFKLDGDPGSQLQYRHVVIATAPYHAAQLLRNIAQSQRLVRQLEALRYEPITTVYLALGELTQLPEIMISLENGPAQWAFDRGQLGGPAGLIACVISAHGAYEQLSREELEITIHQQLEQQLSKRLPHPQWSCTIREKRATFACTPKLLRPGSQTSLRNLWLAGDYIESPYPATLEAAVRSGVAVAETILKRANQGLAEPTQTL